MCRNNQPASKIGVTVNAVARERSDSLCGRELPHGECQGGHTHRDSWYPCRSGQHGDGFLQERNQGGLKSRKKDSQETQTWQGLMSKDHLTNSWDSLNPPLSKTCPDSSTENHNLLHSMPLASFAFLWSLPHLGMYVSLIYYLPPLEGKLLEGWKLLFFWSVFVPHSNPVLGIGCVQNICWMNGGMD